MRWTGTVVLFALAGAACTKGVSPDECRAAFNDILSQYQSSYDAAAALYEHNPDASQNDHAHFVHDVNAAADKANSAAKANGLADRSGWNTLPHIQ